MPGFPSAVSGEQPRKRLTSGLAHHNESRLTALAGPAIRTQDVHQLVAETLESLTLWLVWEEGVDDHNLAR